MMRFIAKIDVKDKRVIKSVRYDGVKKIGDPVVIANNLYQHKIDELFIVNITSTLYDYDNFKDILSSICKKIFVPITVGGGVKTVKDCENYCKLGADKISLNSILFNETTLLNKLARIYGSQSVSVVVQAKKINGDWFAFKDMARVNTGKKVSEWIKKCEDEGAGEIILISVDDDGLCRGLNYELLSLSKSLNIPVILSGGFNPKFDTTMLKKVNLEGICFSNYYYKNNVDIDSFKKEILN